MNTMYGIKTNGVILIDTFRSVTEAYEGAERMGLTGDEWGVVRVAINGDQVTEVPYGNPFSGATSGVW